MVSGDRLFGLPHAEVLHFDAATVYESEIDGQMEQDHPVEIEEWTVHPPRYHLPQVDRLLGWVEECAAEDGEIGEWFDVSFQSDTTMAAAAALLDTIASEITWRMADSKVASHWLTWDEAGEPLLDGKPLYVPAGGAS